MDKRIVRSKIAIKMALLDTLKVKNFPDITVSELAKKANIDRKTFYAHYSSTSDVMDSLEHHLSGEMTKLFTQSPDFNINTFMNGMTDLMFAQFDVYVHIAKSKNYSIMLTAVKSILTNVLVKQFQRNDNYTDTEFYIAMKFIASGIIDHFQAWLKTPDHSKEVLYNSNEMIKKIVARELELFTK